jgi:hypothetical protein
LELQPRVRVRGMTPRSTGDGGVIERSDEQRPDGRYYQVR